MTEPLVYLKVFVALFVLVNPLEGIPIFLARTEPLSPQRRHGIARLAVAGVAIILLVALFLGRAVLAMLSVSIGAFTTAGGIIIFLVALRMVLGDARTDSPDGKPEETGPGFALVPLATPLLAGPGPISSVIVYASKGVSDEGPSLATWLALGAADRLRRVMGETGIEVCTRISGILVAAIAVEMVHAGLLRMFPEMASR